MTKNQFILNVIFFIPLVLINFLFYGINGVIRLVKELNRYSKKYFNYKK